MSSPEIDSTLLDLFREEVRGQVNVLNQGLVELERSSDPSQIEPLMRAAHSIKGAARLIGVDPAVKLAHVMEDCLVAVQQGALQLTSAGIDCLLAGSDWLARTRRTHSQFLCLDIVRLLRQYRVHMDVVEQALQKLDTP